MSIKNIIFDVDGTLLDSKRDIAGAQLWVLRQLGVDRYSAEDLYPHIGKTLQETFSLLLPRGLHRHIPEAAVMYRDYYRPRALDHTTLFPGVKETVEILHHKRINLATATTKSSETTTKVLQHFGIAQYFSQIQGTDDGIPHKPDPYIIRKVLKEQKWKKEETLMTGDTDRDIFCGKNAGVAVCGVTFGTFNEDQMHALHPDFIIQSFPQLLTLV
ncbi:MAG: HAD-IA family hydrolase [Bacteroidota bacterium]|nr:HAD-IA family hydrolase [Bacteroidota bacterium]